MTEAVLQTTPQPVSRVLSTFLGGFITVATPLLLVMFSIRIIMTPLFLQFEYTRPDFPADLFGFSAQDRLTYAPYAIQYLLNAESINFLGDLKFPAGEPMYNERELGHMSDVKAVTQSAYLAATILAVAVLITIIFLWRTNRPALRLAIFNGGIFTLALIAAIIIIAIFNWDFFFTGFHQIFFASGTWRFEYSDTLIRLFPEQFWFDAALLIGGMSLLGALVMVFIGWRWRDIRRRSP